MHVYRATCMHLLSLSAAHSLGLPCLHSVAYAPLPSHHSTILMELTSLVAGKQWALPG